MAGRRGTKSSETRALGSAGKGRTSSATVSVPATNLVRDSSGTCQVCAPTGSGPSFATMFEWLLPLSGVNSLWRYHLSFGV